MKPNFVGGIYIRPFIKRRKATNGQIGPVNYRNLHLLQSKLIVLQIIPETSTFFEDMQFFILFPYIGHSNDRKQCRFIKNYDFSHIYPYILSKCEVAATDDPEKCVNYG